MNKVLKKVNETGTLLVEAMAMLALISMVTPVLYKKAAERTAELQDINAANQLRVFSNALDSYIKDNFAQITDPSGSSTITTACGSVSYDGGGSTAVFDLEQLCEYLPYGFLDGSDKAYSTQMFNDDYQVSIVTSGFGSDAQTVTGFVKASPKAGANFGRTRASRVATMVGSNGGYVTNNVAMGSQGIWQADTGNAGLGFGNLADNTFVVSSLQPISSQGLANEDVLHRKYEPQNNNILNTMETDLFMGISAGTPNNISLVNQIILSPMDSRMIAAGEKGAPADSVETPYAQDLKNALYIDNGGGAYIEGDFYALDSLFTVSEAEGLAYYRASTPAAGGVPAAGKVKLLEVDDEAFTYGNIAASGTKPVFNVSADETKGVSYSYGDATTGTTDIFLANNKMFTAGNKGFKVMDRSTARGTLKNWTGDTTWATVIGGSDGPHSGTYAEYDKDGNKVTEYTTAQPYALTVDGPAYVKDTLHVGQLRTSDIDVANLRAGADPADLSTATDATFYTVTDVDSLVVGANDGAGGVATPRLQISETDVVATASSPDIFAGIIMEHEAGVDISGGAATGTTGGVWADDPQANTLRLGAIDAVEIRTQQVGAGGAVIDGAVNIQDRMLTVEKDDALGIYNVKSAVDEFIIGKTAGGADGNVDQVFPAMYGEDATDARLILANAGLSVYSNTNVPILEVVSAPTGSPDLIDGVASTRATGSFGVYDTQPTNYVSARSGAATNEAVFYVDDDGIVVSATKTTPNTTALGVVEGENILEVDTNVANIGGGNNSIYIRKGVISIEGSGGNRVSLGSGTGGVTADYANATTAQGYITADRFISNTVPAKDALDMSQDGPYNTPEAELYNKYEVNPAYTSVMHDIKLTTRGGARLSDILPDFINKGIYVTDTDQVANVKWAGAGTNVPAKNDAGENDNVSAWTGKVPTPTCPPGYAKVITINPAGWAMSEAGTPGPEFMTKGSGVGDIYTHNNPYLYFFSDDQATQSRVGAGTGAGTVSPLTFQKNTWLKAMALPICNNKLDNCTAGTVPGAAINTDFTGWGVILGFIYPQIWFNHLIDNSGVSSDNVTGDTYIAPTGPGTGSGNTVYWNLFPVKYKQIEAYTTVYCYFDRKNSGFNDEYVDKEYDQINNFRDFYEKDNPNYNTRLNDPALKYKDPW